MGVRNLWDVLESCKKTLPLHHLQNKRICIDLSCWIIRLETVTNGKSFPGDKLYLRGIFHRLRALIALNCSIILVSDGSIPAIKIPAYMRRLNKTTEINKGVPNSEKISLKRNKGSEFSRMTKETKILGMSLGIPCLDGIEEAEAQCALLNSERLCDGCFSPDSDIFLFGARTVYRDICLGDGGYVVCYEMSDIETKLGLGRSSLIALALLLGSDYNPGIPRLHHKAAYEAVKSIGDHAILQKVASSGLSFAKPKKTTRAKKSTQIVNENKENTVSRVVDVNGSERRSATEYSYLDVIDAFLKPKCHSADSEAVYRVLVQHPYQHVKIQQVCGQFFQWTTQKTDELILPKIAERELRRFNNLRTTTSEFGANLPLNEMPIKCPVSKISKQRSIQGKECFEVSWDDCLHGLKASIVPGDLVRSACPEKVVEFEEEKGQKKVPNRHKPKAKKPEQEEASLADIDRRLQKLLLDIESESTTVINSFGSSSPVMISEKSNPISEGKERNNLSKDKEVKEVIDLMSPSPPRPRRGLEANRRENDVHRVVIELSESENDMSPDHARKARELRKFLACIKS